MNMNLQFKGRKEGGRQGAGKKEVNSRQRVGGRYEFQVDSNLVWFSKHYSPDHALPSLFKRTTKLGFSASCYSAF